MVKMIRNAISHGLVCLCPVSYTHLMELGDAFHAYIIDWRLPDMNGIEVTRQIRSLGDDTPIIILTAYDWSDIEAEAKAAGVTAFCAKDVYKRQPLGRTIHSKPPGGCCKCE